MINIFNDIFDFVTNNIYYILITTILFSLCLLVIFIFVSYIVIKLLKTEIDNNSIFFYDYNKNEKKILEKYGDYQVEQIYIVKQPLNSIIEFVINLVTFYKYKRIIEESKECLPHHTQFILSIRLPDNTKKLVLLEKNNSVSLSENYVMHTNKKMKCINIKKKGYTLNKLLGDTLKRIGNNVFFNWHIYKNNCQRFSKEILLTVGKLTKENREFLEEDKIFQKYYPSEFMLHILNCLCVVLNIFEKYIYNLF